MKAVNSIQKELPNVKTLSDLSAYIKRIDEKIPFDPLKGPRNRAAGLLKGILRDAEGDLIGSHVGSEFGEQAVGEYNAARESYSAESKLKDALSDRLGKLGATASYADRIREMAHTDAEGVFNKLSGKNDANLLEFLEQNFPKTAQAIREAHVSQVLSKAKGIDGIDPGAVIKGLDKLGSPQLRAFVTGQSAERIQGISDVLERLKDTNHNWSNTGRTMDKLFQYVPGSAIGLATMLMGHNPAIGFALGALTKYMSKDAPDAVRLGLLKWLGSNKPVEAGAFKSMVDMIHSTIKGENLTDRATRALFSGATKVIPDSLMASDSDIKRLDDKVKNTRLNRSQLGQVASLSGYYLPNHGMAATAMATRAMGYLSSIKPGISQTAPLDPQIEPSDAQNESYHRALEIAQQPLTTLHAMNEDQLTNEDVNHFKAMYPNLHSRLSQKLTDEMMKKTAKGDDIPYRLQVGLSTFMGQPLTGSMNPQTIASDQAIFAQANQEQQAQNTRAKGTPSQVGMRNLKIANRFALQKSDEDT